MNMNNIVTIVIPSYGGGKFLERCVDSTLNQTYKNIEVIVVDDNGEGTENQLKTSRVMSKYAQDDRVRYICHPINKNGSAARNTGVGLAKGDYISLFDDDDEMYPFFIEEHMKVLPNLPSDYALTYCGSDVYNINKELIERREAKFSGQDLYSLFLHEVEVSSSTLVIRKSIYKELGGFDESFRRHQDWEFTVRVMAKYKVYALPIIGYARYTEMRNNPKSTQQALIFRRHYLRKLKPYIEMLPVKQQKDVIIYNLLNANLGFLLNEKDWKEFIREYFKIRPGYRGLLFLLRSARNHLRTLFRKFL